jgi:hypothetical protein
MSGHGAKGPSVARPAGRLQLKVGGRSGARADLEDDADDADADDDDELMILKQPKRGRPIKRHVRRLPPGDVLDEDDAPITDREAFAFLTATQTLCARDDLQEMVGIIIENEPDVRAEGPVIDAALERLRPRTVRTLIRFAKSKFQRLGRPYPEA